MQLYLEHSQNKYPTIRDIRSKLRYNIIHPLRIGILDAFIVGSEAKGTARSDSDLDVAIIINPIRGKSALQYTDQYHQYFSDEVTTPHWGDRKLDFQFFYPDDPELQTYQKIQLLP